MSMYLGPFYIRDSDVFILIALLLTMAGILLDISLPFVTLSALLFFTILLLVARAFVPAMKVYLLYIIYITALLVSSVFTFSVAFLYFVASIVILKLSRQL